MYLAVIAAAMMVACNGKKTAQDETKNDSVCVADSVSADVDLAAVAGTYEGTLPAADCPGIKTVLTINADSTYQLQQDYIDRKDGHDEASGVAEFSKKTITGTVDFSKVCCSRFLFLKLTS